MVHRGKWRRSSGSLRELLWLAVRHSYSSTNTPPPTMSNASASVMSASIDPSSHDLRFELQPLQPPSPPPSEADSNECLGSPNGFGNHFPLHCLYVPCRQQNPTAQVWRWFLGASCPQFSVDYTVLRTCYSSNIAAGRQSVRSAWIFPIGVPENVAPRRDPRTPPWTPPASPRTPPGSNHTIPRYTPTNFHVAKRWRSRVARRSSTDFGAFCDRVWNILVANPVLVYLSARYAPFNGFIATRAPTSGKQLVRCCNLCRKREFGSCSAMVKKSELPPASACSLCLHLKGFHATCFHTCSLVFSSLLHQTNVNVNNQIHLHITSALSA